MMNKHQIAAALKQLDTLPLPDKEKILSACPPPAAAGMTLPATANRRKIRFKPLLAACLAIVLLLSGLSAYVIAAEAREYNQAVTFFQENDLSVAGLSRVEIKQVYRDIQTGSFTYVKTAAVIEESIIRNSVSGYEIFQDEPTPEDLENLWNLKNNYAQYLAQYLNKDLGGFSYRFYSTEKYDEDLGFDVLDQSIFEKYAEDRLIWSAKFSAFWIEDYVIFNGKVIVYGQTRTYASGQERHAWMAMIDPDGTILWQTVLNNGFHDEYIGAILPTDEKIVVFSRGELKYLCLSEYDLKGSALGSQQAEVGNYGIWNAARLGDSYIVQLGSYTNDEHARIVKVSGDGNIVDTFTYDSDVCHYYIADMIEYNQSLYLSAYSVPRLADETKDAGGRYDIAAVLNYIFDNQRFDISNEELTKLMRENFTAVLLVCDSASGIPREFYSVAGSLGGKLALSGSNTLCWDVESITDSFFSPMTSAFTIRGTNLVFRYTFDAAGAIIDQEKTGEMTAFWR